MLLIYLTVPTTGDFNVSRSALCMTLVVTLVNCEDINRYMTHAMRMVTYTNGSPLFGKMRLVPTVELKQVCVCVACLEINLKFITCVNPNMIFLLQSANTKLSTLINNAILQCMC